MSAKLLKPYEIADFIRFIPGEFFGKARDGELFCVGGIFMDEPAGALVYEELSKGGILIRSIFVGDEYRRLYIASEMIELFKGRRFSFSYDAMGDRASLEPFFDAMDIDTVRVDCPVGYFTLDEIESKFNSKGIFKTKEVGTTFADMSYGDKEFVLKWMAEKCNERGEAYDWIHPDSTFLIEGGKVMVAAVLSEIDENYLSLDFLYSGHKDPKMLAGLLNFLIINVRCEYRGDTVVRMIMTTDEGEKFYKSMFGKPDHNIPLISAA